LVVCAVALVLGALGRVAVNYHDVLKAGSVSDFLLYALHCFQWPAREWSWLALVIWSPVVVLAWRTLRRKDPAAGFFPALLLGLAAWVILQILATAYTRGAGGGVPSSRYADTLAFGLIVNGLALGWLWPRLTSRPLRATWGIAWAVTIGCTVYVQTTLIFRHDLPDNRRYLEACEENVRRYLASGDSSHLDSENIPYPGIRALRERIDLPTIRAILPVSVRLPIALETSGSPGPLAAHSTIRLAQRFTALSAALPPVIGSLPKLEQRALWFSDPAKGPGEWRSRPLLFPRGTVLRILIAGHTGADLSILDAQSGTTVVDNILVAHPSADRWRSVHVSLPPGKVIFRATVSAPDGWIAFSDPVEMAHGSYWCWRLTRTGRPIWVTALIGSLLSGLGAWYCAWREKPFR
jgi:hypothetical protein